MAVYFSLRCSFVILGFGPLPLLCNLSKDLGDLPRFPSIVNKIQAAVVVSAELDKDERVTTGVNYNSNNERVRCFVLWQQQHQ